MRKSSQRLLLLGFIIFAFLSNLFFVYRYLLEREYITEPIDENEEINNEALNIINNNTKTTSSYKKAPNEFLVLDWSGKEHIFQEPDPIKCDFSYINYDYCKPIFNSVTNYTHRQRLMRRCVNVPILNIRWTTEQSLLQHADLISYHSLHMPWGRLPKLIRDDKKQQYSSVYVLESEVNSYRGERWHEMDFPLWYNLEKSFPEPITYFDPIRYIKELFTPIIVPFSNKTDSAPIAWISTNCKAFNAREKFIKKLMSYISIDSYGKCLNNIYSHDIKQRTQPNAKIYSTYKFVIAMENSNCEDYISEKLIEAFASTSIPIVASKDGKPDYERFAPKYSYINVYDFKTIQDLANYLKYLSNNQTAYNEYLWFRRPPINRYKAASFQGKTLNQSLNIADKILGKNSTMRKWLLTKETGVNKYCKIVKYIYTNDWNSIFQRRTIDRPTAEEVCLPNDDLKSYFSI